MLIHIHIKREMQLAVIHSNNVVGNVLDCNILVSKFELQSYYYVDFRINSLGKGMKLLIPSYLWIK